MKTLGDRAPGALLVALVILAYLPSLDGGWVWDDHFLLEPAGALARPLDFLRRDVYSAVGAGSSTTWRPLALASFLPGQGLWPGPTSERVLSLVLHAATSLAVARGGRALGAGPWAAAAGAAVFALHPACAEAVAWISGRPDLLVGLLALGGLTLALEGARWAALPLALAPFAKESALVVPFAVLLIAWGQGRLPRSALAGALVGSAAALIGRALAGVPLGAGGHLAELPEALGGFLARSAHVTAVPAAADALPLYTPRPLLGAAGALLWMGLLPLARGRPALALGLAGALLAAPAALALQSTGLVGDRYLYPALGALGMALGPAFQRLSGPARALAALPLAFAPLLAIRAQDWRSDAQIFGASLARDPENPHAAFHVAVDLHLREGDCVAAIPLYAQGRAADPRAGNNLQACLLALGRAEEALALAEELAAASPDSATPRLNSARAALALGREDEARRWIADARRVAPEHPAIGELEGSLEALPEGGTP